MHRRAVSLFSVALLASAMAPATAAAPASKPLVPKPHIASLSQLPADIRKDIGPDIADRGQAFAAGCVGAKGEAHSRFSGARIDADVAQVTIERGGFAHFFEQLEFRRVDGRWVRTAAPDTKPAPSARPAS